MRRRISIALTIACATAALFAVVQQGSAKLPPRAPADFFGIAPQTKLSDRDAEYMAAGGIDVVRWPLTWGSVQPGPNDPYNWSEFDPIVATAARHGLKVLPFVYGTPGWVARKPTKLPVDNAKGRNGWAAFLKAAVKRYGPRGEFWKATGPGVNYQPAIPRPLPIRTWQIWNEANFFYFAYPASPQRYTRLLKISTPAIKGVDRGAKVVLSGLFGEPTARGASGMPSAKFLEIVYRTPGVKRLFDGIALHPYAVDAETLEELVEGLHDVTTDNRDRVPMYITEMGWGSQNNFQEVAFEQGPQGQVRQLRDSYAYLLENRNRLDLKQVYWFSWKDIPDACSFCDSVGLFRQGVKFKPKPSWNAFLQFSRGRARP